MNTLEISEKLKKAGATEPQAQAVTSAIQEGVRESKTHTDERLKGVATKEDIADLKAEMRASENRQLWHAILIMVAMTAIFSYISKGF